MLAEKFTHSSVLDHWPPVNSHNTARLVWSTDWIPSAELEWG